MHIETRGRVTFIKLIKSLCVVRERERERERGATSVDIVLRTQHIGIRFTSDEVQRGAQATPGR